MTADNKPCTVKLDVRDNYSKGYEKVTGQNYWYKYAGGNQGNGHVHHKATNNGVQAKVTIQLDTADYKIVRIDFEGEHYGQLTATGTDEHTREIENTCTQEMEAHYKVRVCRVGARTAIPCDPMIKNVKV